MNRGEWLELDYNYPISIDWTTEEIITVIGFYEAIEKAYETGIQREDLLESYRRFKEIVPSMAEEKTLLKQFEEVSGYVGFPVIKEARNAEDGERIKGVTR